MSCKRQPCPLQRAENVCFAAFSLRLTVQYPERLAEYFSGLKDSRTQPGNADELKKWQLLRERWGFAKTMDNARHFALKRQHERLSLPAWEAFADAARNNKPKVVSAQLAADFHSSAASGRRIRAGGVLPLSIDDVDRANRWLAGEAAPAQRSLNDELEVCRQTLAKIRELHSDIHTGSGADKAMKKPWLEGIEVVDVNNPVSAWGGWLETLVLTAIVLVASFVTQQHDPFRLGGGFPWPVLAPLLAGLRYGFVSWFCQRLADIGNIGSGHQPAVAGRVRVSAGMGDWRRCRGDGGRRVSRYVGTPLASAGGRLSISRGTP